MTTTTPPRVVPLFCDELLASGPVSQHMHLLMLKERWVDLSKAKVTMEDAEMLIRLLLAIAVGKVRPNCKAEGKHTEKAAELSLLLLFTALCEPSLCFRVLHQGMLSVMNKLEIVEKEGTERVPEATKSDYALIRREIEMQAYNERKTLHEKHKETAKRILEYENFQSQAVEHETIELLRDTQVPGIPVGMELNVLIDLPDEERLQALRNYLETIQAYEEEIPHTALTATQHNEPKQNPLEQCERDTDPSIPFPTPRHRSFPEVLSRSDLSLEMYLQNPSTRFFTVQLLKAFDSAGANVQYFTKGQNRAHLYIPHRASRTCKIFRDFITCPPRPKGSNTWGPDSFIHIKTNIKSRSDIMYRFLVEGYNYGTNSIIHSDICGYSHRKWAKVGKGAMEEAGWPEGWDNDVSTDYMTGATVDQYYSADGYVVISLKSRSFFCTGFSVSAWLVVHGFGANHELTATIHHQDAPL